MFDQLIPDVRYGLRALAARPGFTAAAIATLALGIGANAAIFNVIDALLLRPLPYPHGDRLVTIDDLYPKVGEEQGGSTIPDYLDRPEMVTRIGANELRLSKNSRWGEPLKVGFAHVLARDLAMRLSAAQIHRFPWYNSSLIDYQVKVAVHHFETDASGRSELIAHWTIIDGRNHDVLDSSNTTLVQSGKPGDPAASVAALSHMLGQFSGRIATRLRRLAEQRQARAQTHAK